MITKIRKFGESEYISVVHLAKACVFCVASRQVRWLHAGDVIFFENEAGTVHRVEALCVGGSVDSTAVIAPERGNKTPGGLTIVVCPAEYVPEKHCANCGLCQNRTRGVIVGFRAHGDRKQLISAKQNRQLPLFKGD